MSFGEELIYNTLYFLAAVIVTVPIFKRIGLGEIPGYLVAGILIGPFCLSLINDPERVLYFSEIGVVLLLFSIGLEVSPEKLRSMRRHIFGMGAVQLVLSAVLILGCVFLLSALDLAQALVVGLALALSSTAFAIQLLVSRGVMASESGRISLSILLFQDLAVVPSLLLIQVLSGISDAQDNHLWLYGPPAIIGLLLFGRYLMNPILTFIARFGERESMMAITLLIVAGAAFLMHAAHLPVGLGAFIAGMLLANSVFRHQLEAEIEPFKILTLGIFFAAIGMALDFDLLLTQPVTILLLALALMAGKTIVIALLALAMTSVSKIRCFQIGLLLSQGGEFGFVIMREATNSGLLDTQPADMVRLVIGLSMVLTAPLILLFDKMQEKYKKADLPSSLKQGPKESAEVIILGYGRFGQILGRVLTANGVVFNAIDNNSNYLRIMRKTGQRIHFGDSSRLDVIEQIGLKNAKAVILAHGDVGQSEKLVHAIRDRYLDLTIIARARNRHHYTKLKEAGADIVIREIFEASLSAAMQTLIALGYSSGQAFRSSEIFKDFDHRHLEEAVGKCHPVDYWVTKNKELEEELKYLHAQLDHADGTIQYSKTKKKDP